MDLLKYRLLVVTDATQAGPGGPVEVLRRAREGGDFSVLLRDKHIRVHQRREMARELGEFCSDVLVSDPEWPHSKAHLSSRVDNPRWPHSVLGRSRHVGDPPHLDAGLSYVTFSPVWVSASKPGYGPALGLAALRSRCEESPVPVYALGGVEAPERARAAREAGAHGVAVMGAVMRAEDPAAVIAAFNGALHLPPARRPPGLFSKGIYAFRFR
ncbi:thiamine phosphate synthase [Salininema proteolyticum]|uniref:Thiamine phosphate synthase n=1 Tax=Salininema proteolyticum TaxID=1607685 RepID=A0ABV8U1L2_9ACTN